MEPKEGRRVMQGQRKLFTVQEANQTLPRVTRLMRSLRERFRWLDGHRQQVPFMLAEYNIVDESPVDMKYFQALISVRGLIGQVEKLGVQIKDINTGLVDFPARIHGRDVLLCWRLGESRVRFYHAPESGYAGRQLLPDSSEIKDSDDRGH